MKHESIGVTIYNYDPDNINKKQYVEVAKDVAELLVELFREANRERANAPNRNRILQTNAEILIQHTSDALDVMIEKELLQSLYAAIGSLCTVQKRRIIKHFFDDLSVSAIAQQEGVSAASVSIAIQRGIRNIQSYMKQHV